MWCLITIRLKSLKEYWVGVVASGSSFISGGFDEGMVGRETWRRQHKVVNNSSLLHLFFEKHYKYKRLKK